MVATARRARERQPRRRAARLALLTGLCWMNALGGCAMSTPALVGGSTTPHHRVDTGAGAGARVPTGRLRAGTSALMSGTLRDATQARGVAPIAMLRVGVNRHVDIEALGSATGLRLGLRREWVIEEDVTRPTWMVGAALLVDRVRDPGTESTSGAAGGARVGVDVPLTYSVDFGGVYEAWGGLRAGLDHIRGRFLRGNTAASARATALRLGPVIGIAAGHRRFHVLVEVTVAYEQWWTDHGGADERRGGVVFLPAFALRVRI